MRKTLCTCLFLLVFFIGCNIQLFSQQWQVENNKARTFLQAGNLDSALIYGQRAVDAAAIDPGKRSISYASCITNLAYLNSTAEDYNEAIRLYKEVVEIWKELYGPESERYALDLQNLGDAYFNNGEYLQAEQISKKALELRKRILGTRHPDYLTSVNNLGLVYSYLGEYKKAEALLLEATELGRQLHGEFHEYYATDLSNLAILYRKMGNYEQAEPLLLKSTEIREKLVGKEADYAVSLSSLGVFYQDIGQYQKAFDYYMKAIEALNKTNRVSTRHAAVYNNLALLYSDMGFYEKAEPLYLKANEIKKQIYGATHPQYALGVYNLGLLYKYMGLFEKAEPLLLQSMDIWKSSLGEEHPDYSSGLVTLGSLYEATGRKKNALALYISAAEIDRRVYGEDNPFYASSLSHIAGAYLDEKDYASAEKQYLRARDIRVRYFGKMHPSIAKNSSSLAYLYQLKGNNTTAEKYYLEAREIAEKTLGRQHPDYGSILDNMALFYAQKGEIKKAEKIKIEDSQIHLQSLLNMFSVLTEKEKGTFIVDNSTLLESNNSFLFSNRSGLSPAFAKNNFNLQLAFKSLTLSSTKELLHFFRNSTDSVVSRMFKEWYANKNFLSRQFSLPIAERVTGFDSIQRKTEMQEKKLLGSSVEFQKQQNSSRLEMEDIQKQLGLDEVAIEFVRFNLFTDHWTDTILYAAYVLKKNAPGPQFVYLCREDQLGKYFQMNASGAGIKSLYRSEVEDDDNDATISGDSLYALVWKPLEAAITGARRISMAPVGLLNRIAFHALPLSKDSVLIDRYEINQFISIRQLVVNSSNHSGLNSISLFGDCLFSDTTVNKAPGSEKLQVSPINLTRGGNGWAELPGTAAEVDEIAKLFVQNKLPAQKFTRQFASEQQFKSLNGKSPAIIHLATHGFFLPDATNKTSINEGRENVFRLSDDPLMRSGVVLSGANSSWTGKQQTTGNEDGILTAYEIAQLDLSATNLVVLSACETALGDIRGNEGVFGLQRAFKLAGVKAMLLSLWKVPDAETGELMKLFYTYYIENNNIRGAFSKARSEMRRKYPPYYWAAFVLIE